MLAKLCPSFNGGCGPLFLGGEVVLGVQLASGFSAFCTESDCDGGCLFFVLVVGSGQGGIGVPTVDMGSFVSAGARLVFAVEPIAGFSFYGFGEVVIK